MNCQAISAITTYSVIDGLPSQFCRRKPRLRDLDKAVRPPKFGSSRASHISAMPAVDSSSGSTYSAA